MFKFPDLDLDSDSEARYGQPGQAAGALGPSCPTQSGPAAGPGLRVSCRPGPWARRGPEAAGQWARPRARGPANPARVPEPVSEAP